MQDASSEAAVIAAARWSQHSLDRGLRLLAVLGLAAAVVLALGYLAPFAEELVSDGE
jgi:hypothetical protein